MTVSDQKTEDWAPFPDARHYQADAISGNVRSLPHYDRRGRFHKGADPLKAHPDADGYMRFNYTDDKGVRHHNASRARCVLMAHDPGGWFEGAEACHGPGGNQDDRLANLRWDTGERNRFEALEVRMENNPPAPKPLKECARCGAGHDRRGRNCLACMTGIGEEGARRLVAGERLEKIAEDLRYPAVGVINLAVTYGGLRFHREGHAPSPRRRSLSVLFHREPSRRNSDGA